MSPARTAGRSSEQGFTLVELMVIIVILAVLGAIAVQSVQSTRQTGGKLEMKAAANRYGDAIERYQTDHGRQLPIIGSASWPSNSRTTLARGPVKVLSIGAGTPVVRPYLKGDPPLVMTRDANAARLLASGTAPARGGALYYRRTGVEFRIDAYWNGRIICSAGDIRPGERSC